MITLKKKCMWPEGVNADRVVVQLDQEKYKCCTTPHTSAFINIAVITFISSINNIEENSLSITQPGGTVV